MSQIDIDYESSGRKTTEIADKPLKFTPDCPNRLINRSIGFSVQYCSCWTLTLTFIIMRQRDHLFFLLALFFLVRKGSSLSLFKEDKATTAEVRHGLQTSFAIGGMAASEFDKRICEQAPYSKIKDNIATYIPEIMKIVDYISSGPFKGVTYRDTVDFVDEFSSRLAGSEELEKSIDSLYHDLQKLQTPDRVWTEDVRVPKWQRCVKGDQYGCPNISVLAFQATRSWKTLGSQGEKHLCHVLGRFGSNS